MKNISGMEKQGQRITRAESVAQQNLLSWHQCLSRKTLLAGISSCHWQNHRLILRRHHSLLCPSPLYPSPEKESLSDLYITVIFLLCPSPLYPSPEKESLSDLYTTAIFLLCPSPLYPSPEKEGLSDFYITAIFLLCSSPLYPSPEKESLSDLYITAIFLLCPSPLYPSPEKESLSDLYITVITDFPAMWESFLLNVHIKAR